jgi:hypothetical protein
MQLRKMAFVAALSTFGFMMAGCPEDTATSTTCSTTADCVADSEICHPTAKVCVQTCTEGSDCPDSSPTCAALSDTDTTLVCQCTTDSGCNTDRETADLLCDPESAVCVQRCTSDATCSTGSTCNLTTGVCESGGVGTTCAGEGLSTCDYGNICTASTCQAPAAPACENYTNLSADRKATLGTTGPIIFATSLVSAQADTAFCPGSTANKRVRVKLSVYNDEDFPSSASGLNGFFYVLVNGNAITPVVSTRADSYVRSENNRRLDTVVEFCEGNTATRTQTGFYFTGGNFACYLAQY